MSKVFLILYTILAGIGTGIQPSLNAGLGKQIGPFAAAFVSFGVGTLVLAGTAFLVGNNNFTAIKSVPWYYFLGGVIGAVFVTATLLATPVIGSAAALTITIAGQIIVALIIDHFGLFGTAKIQLNVWRVLGFVLILVGIRFIFR